MMTRNTKIICTIGPAIDNEQMLEKMFKAGMNIARLNFSHGTPKKAIKQIERIRNVADKVGKHIAIMLDTKGPEIRTGCFENDSCTYDEGDIVQLVKEEVLGNKERFHITCKELFNDVNIGNVLLIDDGKIKLYPTGSMFVAPEEWIKDFLTANERESMIEEVLSKKSLLMPDKIVNQIVDESKAPEMEVAFPDELEAEESSNEDS